MRTLIHCVIIGIVLIATWSLIYPKVYLTPNDSSRNVGVSTAPTQAEPTVPLEQRVLKGTYICLPHKNAGPQTLECAFGIKASDGYNYAISMDETLMNKFKTGKSVTLTGLVMSIEAISSDHWSKYDIRGIMQVESATE